MPEENQQDTNEEVVEETTTQGEEQPEDLSASEEPTEATETDAKESDGELPEGTKDRTKEQFEKLKKSNAQLKAELEQRKQLPSVLDYLGSQPPQVSQEVRQRYEQPQVPQAPVFNQPQPLPQEELMDEQGYVNADVLQRRLDQADQARIKAEEAERRAVEAQQRIMRFEQDSETKKLYESYPELDPLNDNFNKDAYDLVRNELTSQIVQTGNRDALSAATKMSKYFRQQSKPDSKAIDQRSQVTSSSPASGSLPRPASKPVSQMTSMERLAAWEARNNIK